MFDKLQDIISKTENRGAEFVDARYDELLIRTIIRENERIEECTTLKRAGVGFNVYYKGAMGYAYSADLTPKALEQAADNALGIAKAGSYAVSIKPEIEPLSPITEANFKPNLRELRDGLGIELTKPITIVKLDEAADVIFSKMNVGIAFITLSEEGIYINNRKDSLIVPTHKRTIYPRQNKDNINPYLDNVLFQSI